MDEPLVCCICPTRDRPELFKQALACYHSQTYRNKQITVLDNTHEPKVAIGLLRNRCIAGGGSKPQIIAHWDDDDWSCPTRIAEQVAFIQSSGASIVGYRDMPFYDVQTQRVTFYRQTNPHFALGTSLMYWRSVWEQHPFIEVIGDEDSKFQQAVGHAKVETQSSVQDEWSGPAHAMKKLPFPRMVARIHPGNTSKKGGARYEKATPDLEAAVKACIAPSNLLH